MKIIWSPRSMAQLMDLAEYIALNKPEAAHRWLENVFHEVEKIKLFPKSGRKVPEINQDKIREIIFGNYRVIYKIENDVIIIASVRHGEQLLEMKDIKVLLKSNDINELLSIPHLKEILKLCQILNTVRSAQRLLIITEKYSKGLIRNRDIFYGLITISSYVFEGIKTSEKILTKIATLIPKDKKNEIAWIRSEINNKKSFYNRVIAKIRNNIGFHFNYSITNEQIRKVADDFPLTFAQSRSEKKIDFVYLMADQLMSEMSPFSNITNIEKEKELKNMIIKLGEYANRFCDFLEETIAISLRQHLELID
ncbi:type II toxin-antitoxin system RelE/ParE family toxin [Calditrichota bacterium GD2]